MASALPPPVAGRRRELGLLLMFGLAYLAYAWGLFHKRLCGFQLDLPSPLLATCQPYPCGGSLLHKLSFHAVQPHLLIRVAFFQPQSKADVHDALSVTIFMLGGAWTLGACARAGQRHSKLRLAWLLLSVAVPKSWLLLVAWRWPGDGLGAAVELMLPRHSLLALWLSLAFPVRGACGACVGVGALT